MKNKHIADIIGGIFLGIVSSAWLGYLIGLRILNWNPQLWSSVRDIFGLLLNVTGLYILLGIIVGSLFTILLKTGSLLIPKLHRNFLATWLGVYSLITILLFSFLTISRSHPEAHVKVFDKTLVIAYVLSLLVFFLVIWLRSVKREMGLLQASALPLLTLIVVGLGTAWIVTPKIEKPNFGDPVEIASAFESANPQIKVAIFGVDGAEWSIIDKLLAEGKMPVMQNLIENGVRARFLSLNTLKSPLIWTSMATGKLPRKHGVEDFGSFQFPLMQSSFINYPDGIGFYRLVLSLTPKSDMPITSTTRRVEAIWDILSRAGLSSGVAGWWATWPADEINGGMISDRFTYSLFNPRENARTLTRGQVYPPELLSEIDDYIRASEEMTEAEISRFVNGEIGSHIYPEQWKATGYEEWNPLYQLKTGYTSGESFLHASLHLLDQQQPNFYTVYLEGNDMVSHFFWQYMDDSLYPEPIPPEEKAKFAEVVPRFYSYWDSLVGAAIEHLDEDTHIIVVSDHGFGPTAKPAIPYRGGDHLPYGIFIASGPNFREGCEADEASVLDLTPTLLYLYGMPTGEDMDGRIMEDIFTDEFKSNNPGISLVSYETGRRIRSRLVSSDVDEAIKKQLRSLGYAK